MDMILAKTTGLRTEIIVTLSLLLGAALLFGGLVMLRFTEVSLLEERVSQLDILTRLLSSSEQMKQSSEQRIQFLNTFPEISDCQGWWLYDHNLKLIGSWVETDNAVVEPSSAAIRNQTKLSGTTQRFVEFSAMLNFLTQRSSTAQFVVPLVNQKQFSGILELTYSLQDIRNRLLTSLVLILLYIFLYGIVLIGAGFFLLQRNIIKPARKLLAATGAVGKGNLNQRLPIDGPAEIRQLAGAYNDMVNALQKSQAETINQIKNLEATNLKLEQTRNELIHREKMVSVGHLAAGLAHELGNPLAALIGYLELLKSKVQDSTEQDLIERSLVETNRIDFLVRELLNFSRPGNLDDVEDVCPVTVLKDSVTLLLNQGTINETDIEYDFPVKALKTVQMNGNKLRQVFINILLNACQACDAGGKIILRAGEDKKHVWVSIKDNGQGIAESDLERIFEPFYTTKQTGIGTGLGLAVCRRIIDEVGGKILVESKLEEGSQFTLQFRV